MGEKSKNVIRLDAIEKRPSEISPVHHNVKESKFTVAKEVKVTLSNKNQSKLTSHVTRILREILEATVINDITDKKNAIQFIDILRFYSNTSYGATSVATMKRRDLFNAMRALSPYSPFIYAMARMMHVPDTLPYDQDFVYLYSVMWKELLDQGFLSNHPPIIELDRFMNAFKLSVERQGTCLPPSFFSTVQKKLQAIIIERREFSDDDIWVDIDKALLCVLDELESNDIRWKEFVDQLFGKSIFPHRILLVRDKESNRGAIKQEMHGDDMPNALMCAKQLLFELIIEDDHRLGVLPNDLFCKIIQRWYEYTSPDVIPEGIVYLASLFRTEGATVDYMEYFCLLHSFVLENACTPNLQRTISFLVGPHRGVESCHYKMALDFLSTARLQRLLPS
jgi:hypothetical protein